MDEWHGYYQRSGMAWPDDLGQVDRWQELLADIIAAPHPSRVLEAGSGFGQTSLLVARQGADVTLLDLELVPLQGGKHLFQRAGEPGFFVRGNLMDLPFTTGSFDTVFNGGVLEHFDFSGRCQALAEMARCTSPEGRVVVAVPNHFSRPYRYSYLYRKQKGQWPYPDEQPIYDLSAEIAHLGLQMEQERLTVDQETSYVFLRRHQRWLFRLWSWLTPFEGYLLILILTRPSHS